MLLELFKTLEFELLHLGVIAVKLPSQTTPGAICCLFGRLGCLLCDRTSLITLVILAVLLLQDVPIVRGSCTKITE